MAINALPPDIPSPFVLLDAVTEAEANQLTALRRFNDAPVWQALEAAAQAAALHQRWLADFACHAFLLSVDACIFPDLPERGFNGTARLRAILLGQSDGAATYRVELRLPDTRPDILTDTMPTNRPADTRQAEDGPDWFVTLTIGRASYDASFQQSLLESRYRGLFQCLTNAGHCAPALKTG